MSPSARLTGAQALVGTLAHHGVTACFANPGTSEMHAVTALDGEPRVRSILGLFEGVVTGAADGYARVSGNPAMTLLHLGSGYLNGGANIHNARRARSPIINVIGDHATYHLGNDAPLTSDIQAMAAPNSKWLRAAAAPEDAGRLAAEAWHASLQAPTGPVSLVLPADVAWLPGASIPERLAAPERTGPDSDAVEHAARALRAAQNPTLLMTGPALTEPGLRAARRLAGAGVRVLFEFFFPRLQRGAGRYAPERMEYFAERVVQSLDGTDVIVLAEARPPVAFFAYPNQPCELAPDRCEVISLGGPEIDSAESVIQLANALGATGTDVAPVSELAMPNTPQGELSVQTIGLSIARHLPEGAFVSDEAGTSGGPTWAATASAAPHDWMPLTGGALGQGLPVALGAAIAAPERKGLCLVGDGAAMYTNQALWTMAREGTDIVTVVFVNRSYRILNIELARTGAGAPGPTAQHLLSLSNPPIDFASLARSMGVPSTTATTAEGFDRALAAAFANDGPHLIAAEIA